MPVLTVHVCKALEQGYRESVGLMYVDSTWPWMLKQLQDNLRAIKFSPHSKTCLINIFMKANFEANQSPSADTTVLNQIRHAKLRNIS